MFVRRVVIPSRELWELLRVLFPANTVGGRMAVVMGVRALVEKGRSARGSAALAAVLTAVVAAVPAPPAGELEVAVVLPAVVRTSVAVRPTVSLSCSITVRVEVIVSGEVITLTTGLQATLS